MANYWLMKSEPDVFSIDDLKKKKKSLWDGVRNYQARNFMTQDMKVGDLVLFYHSSAEPPGVAGLARVSKPSAADQTALDKRSPYFDPKSTTENPIWFCVEVEFQEKFKNFVTLSELKNDPKLTELLVIKRGQRLSIQPVTKPHFEHILELGRIYSSSNSKNK